MASSIQAVICRKLGDPKSKHPVPDMSVETTRLRTDLAPNEVRIRVAAASINFADVLQLQGLYQDKPKLPFIPGNEVSGVVLAAGSEVSHLYPGDDICGVTQGGAFAEECILTVESCMKVPYGLDIQAAAAIPVAFGTAHVALKERAALQPGQTVLILGAAGGVGLAAVQIAKAMEARVVAVAGGAEKGRAVREAGADVWIDSSQPDLDLRAEISKVVSSGVDVLFDNVGGKAFDQGIRCMKAFGGQVLLIGFASGIIPKVSASQALIKNMTLHGVYWGLHLKHNPKMLRDSLQQILAWAAAGRLRVNICQKIPLQQSHDAVKLLFDRKSVGKVLIVPGHSASSRM